MPFREALRFWLWLGCVSFGGPAGQIAIMHRELVEKRRWISERRFLHALNYCMLLPGPEAQQLATYIGWLLHGARGGIAAGALFVLPSWFVLVGLSWAYMSFGTAATDALYGIKPAVVAIVAFAAWRIGSRVLHQGLLWAIAGGSLLGMMLGLPFPALVLAAALIGWLARDRLKAGPAHRAAGTAAAPAPALIDDHHAIPEHAVFTRRRLVLALVAGVGLWAVSIGILAVLGGGESVFTRVGVFFTKAALVTFGGAYAVLPYVFQHAVDTHHWLTPAQMMDGLALGETTPGPLIMVVAFIGFVGAWTQQALGPELLLAGAAGAAVATWFTFLPSFVFILAGAPWVEHTRADFRLGGPLTAITAAVVGTIVGLGLYLAAHVFWPQGLGAPPDLVAVALALLAFVLLRSGRLGMIPVILGSALLGLGAKLLLGTGT